MAATKIKQMWYWAGPIVPIRTALIAASQGIFMPGAPCYVSTSGTVKLADTCDGTGDVFHGFITGVVDKAKAWPLVAELAANDEIRIGMIKTDTIFACYMTTGATDSPAAQDNVGDSYGLTVSTTAGEIGYTTVNESNANTAVTVQNIASNVEPALYTTSDDPGVLLVTFLPANIDAVKA